MIKTRITRVPITFLKRLDNMYQEEQTRTKKFTKLNKALDELLFGIK